MKISTVKMAKVHSWCSILYFLSIDKSKEEVCFTKFLPPKGLSVGSQAIHTRSSAYCLRSGFEDAMPVTIETPGSRLLDFQS